MKSWTCWCSLCVVLLAFITPPAQAQDPRLQQLGETVTRADALQKQGKHGEAIGAYAEATTLATQLFGANHINVAALSQAQGLLLRELGAYEQAGKLIETALRIAEANNDRDLAAEAVNNLAAVKWQLGQYAEALKLHERSLEMLRAQYGDRSPNVAISRSNLAGTYSSLGQYAKAEPLYLESIRVLDQHRGSHAPALADALMNLADLYTQQGELTRAELLLLRSMELKERSLGANHYEVARTLNNLAALYSMMGQYPKAEQMHLRTLRILETSLGGESLDVARSLVNLANLYQRQHQHAKAVPLFDRALAIREKHLQKDHPDVALTLHNMGGLYTHMGDHAKARQLYERALAIRESRLGEDHPVTAHTLMALANLSRLEKQHEESERLYQRALAIRSNKLPAHHPDRAYTHQGLGVLAAATARWEEAATQFDRARRGFRRYIDQVLPALSENDQLTFLQEVDEEHYHSALSLVARGPKSQRIVDLSATWVTNGKGIAQQTLAQRALLARDKSNPVVAEIAEFLLMVRKQLASLSLVDGSEGSAERRRRIEELSRQEQEQSRLLALRGGRAAGTGEWVELEKVRQSIPTDAVLIEIARFKVYDYKAVEKQPEDFPQHYLAWIIPAAGQGSVRAVDLGPAEAIDASVKEARLALQKAPGLIQEQGEPEAEQALRPALEKLAKQILHPLMAEAGGRERVYLSPDSVLWLVPWSALPLEDGGYAIEKYDFRFIVSGRDLVKSAANFTPGQPILFADPNYDLSPAEAELATRRVLRQETALPSAVRATPAAGTFKLGTAARLPGTQIEAAAVSPKLEAYTGAKPLLYSDQWALEAVFKAMRQPRVLMLSTHGFFAEEESAATAMPANPLLRCGLLLAGCNQPTDTSRGVGEDGILTGLEIISADLRGTELVVLSACETGLGEVRNGEGVAGLRQAFQLAGARSVIATLWQIPDNQTARLMSDFFANLVEESDKSASLRKAQLRMIESRRSRYGAAHPFFWAAFTITGA